MYCQENWDNDHMRDMHGDEKLFVLMPGGSSGRHVRYVKKEDMEKPHFTLVVDKGHPPQVMVTGIVARPDPSIEFDGKVCLFLSYQEEDKTQRGSINRPRTHAAINLAIRSSLTARHAYGDPNSQVPIGHVRLSGVRRRRLWQAPTCRRMASAPFRTDKVMASHGGVGGSLLA